MYRHRYAGLTLLVMSSLLLAGQVSANEDFRKWLQQQQSSFQQYKDERDREFTSFLKNQWKEMELLRGFKRDENPKPPVMPVAPPADIEPVAAPKPVIVEPRPDPLAPSEPKPEPKPEPVVSPPPVITPPQPVVKPAQPPMMPPIKPGGRKINISYYGNRLSFYYDPKLKSSLAGRLNENSISEFWSTLSQADYDALIEQLDSSARSLQLNDWAYALLVHHVAERIYPAAENTQSLFTWFVLIKAGYRARIAYDNRKVYLLVPSQQKLYSVPYFTFDKVRYYAVRFDGGEQSLGQVYTYDGNYPGANKALDMQLRKDMIVDSRLHKRDLSFDFDGQRYMINASYDTERVDFLNTYPQLDLEWYFRSNVSATSSAPLVEQLRVHIQGMDEKTAVNFLLRFVQTSLQYKTDENQFGKENYLFAEETLRYPYSDCEDRSVLFAWLVKNLLGLEVIGLDFPGHVATAVSFSQDVSGDAIMYKGKRYVVADPTYVNAVVGMTMPDYKNTTPGVIKIND